MLPASTAFFERKSAGMLNFSKAISVSLSRLAVGLNDGSAISSGWSVGSQPRQFLRLCSINASAASQSCTIPSRSAPSTVIPARGTERALVPTWKVRFEGPSCAADSSPAIIPTLDGITNFGQSSPA